MPQRSPTTPLGKDILDLVRAIVAGDAGKAARLVDNAPTLIHARSAVGATRQGAEPYFFEAIAHYMYGGDTALHMAAAGFKREIAQALIDRALTVLPKIAAAQSRSITPRTRISGTRPRKRPPSIA